MRRRHKLSLQIDNSIKEITTTTATTIITVVTPYITAINRNYVALYITRKDIAYGNIPRRSKKSLRLSLRTSLRTASRSE